MGEQEVVGQLAGRVALLGKAPPARRGDHHLAQSGVHQDQDMQKAEKLVAVEENE